MRRISYEDAKPHNSAGRHSEDRVRLNGQKCIWVPLCPGLHQIIECDSRARERLLLEGCGRSVRESVRSRKLGSGKTSTRLIESGRFPFRTGVLSAPTYRSPIPTTSRLSSSHVSPCRKRMYIRSASTSVSPSLGTSPTCVAQETRYLFVCDRCETRRNNAWNAIISTHHYRRFGTVGYNTALTALLELYACIA